MPSEYPSEVKPGAPSGSVAGATWHFCGYDHETITFELDHTITSRVRGETDDERHIHCPEGSNRWTQEKNHVVFDTCGFTEFEATIRDGGKMYGTWRRLRGKPEHAYTCLQKNR